MRSNVSKAVSNRLRHQVAADAGDRCEICGARGRRWPVECHETWDYDDDRKIQRLQRLVALCPACHEVKHAGLASKRVPHIILSVITGTIGPGQRDLSPGTRGAMSSRNRRDSLYP